MKGFVVAILCVITAGVGYCAWRSGALDDVLSPRVRYVEAQPAESRWAWHESRCRGESAAEWAERVYGDMYADSGVPEVDEAMRAHRVLRTMPEDSWPHEWIRRKDRARSILDGAQPPRPMPSGQDERCVGASERVRPGWAGPRGWREGDESEAPVPAGEALRRFLFGVPEEGNKL